MQNPLMQHIDYVRYLKLFWRRKWVILVPTVLLPLAAGYYAMGLPDRFKSTTLILVQPQRVPAQFVPTTVGTPIQERLQTISQQIFSRTRLEQIVREFSLFQDASEKRAPEEVMELMRRRIELKVHRNDAFQLSFVDADPRRAMMVTNKLAGLFIDENLKVREQQAIGTSQFLGEEIERYREQVREREQVILEFKTVHMAEMPEQLAANQARLGQLQNQLQINTQNINGAENRRVQLQQQMAEIERRVEEQSEARPSLDRSISELLLARFRAEEGLGPAGGEGELAGIREEIGRRDREVSNLLVSYTERHPDVVRLRAEIAKLREREEAERSRIEAEKPPPVAEAVSAPSPEDPTLAETPGTPRYPSAYEKLGVELARTEAEIARLEAETAGIQRQIEAYQARVAAVPGRQLQIQQLSDDYENLKKVLNSLIDKKLQADLAENLERKQKGEQFQVLDPANLPARPFQPNRLRLVAMGLFGGLAAGFGIVLLLDLVDLRIGTRQELTGILNLPVLGVIPRIVTPRDVHRRKVRRLAVSGGVLACLLLAAGVVHFAVKPLPEAVGGLATQVRSTHWTAMR
ncbi:MAG: XrtA system polysaccharide chain length determinant [Deferrisomatales bacterium]